MNANDIKTVKDLHTAILSHPEYEMSLLYNYGRGYLRFWKVSNNTVSALDGVGNRVAFKLDSDFTFNAANFSMSEEYAMVGGVRTIRL